MASTESAYSSGSGEAEEHFGAEEDTEGDEQHQQHGGEKQDGGRQLQQELRARIMASPYASAWPRASIPRRVHKLSWEEEQMGRHHF